VKKKPSRRDFLKVLAAAMGAGVIGSSHWVRQALLGNAQGQESKQFLPLLEKAEIGIPSMTPTRGPTSTPEQPAPTVTKPAPPETDGRVVHVHSPDATFWDPSDHRYWNYVDQDVVNNMVDQGLMSLTGQPDIHDAWSSLLPNYHVGQGIAVKVNFNNSSTCDDTDHQIDALIQPVNALVRGMKQIGVAENDIWIYDAIRSIPDRFVSSSRYEGIQYFDNGCHNIAGFSNTYVTFYPPLGVTIPPIRLTDLLVNATYLIDIPIMKCHSGPGATGNFKNHFGSIEKPGQLHNYVCLDWDGYRSDYSPFVDLHNSPHIGDKTVLYLGDGLFAAGMFNNPPQIWATFGNQVPNSLFFSVDPVATDCIMFDFLNAEFTIPDASYNYLQLACEAGLGIYERGDPWGSGYNLIDYQQINL
jgi:hypothetical protein